MPHIGDAPEQVVRDALEHLRTLSYREGTIRAYRQSWSHLLTFATARRFRGFSVSLVARFRKFRGLSAGRRFAAVSPEGKMIRALRVLEEFATAGNHRRAALRKPRSVLPSFMEKALRAVGVHIRQELCWAESTRTIRMYWLRLFLQYRRSRAPFTSWRSLSDADLPAYIESLGGSARDTRRTAFYSVKAMLRLLFLLGHLRTPLHERTPRFFSPQDGSLHPIWLPDEITAVLAAVDRSRTTGKRDYAILLLAARLGLRACDIRALRLDDLCWERSCMELVQQKTGVPFVLPMPEDVGEALIDYLRNARPTTPHREVFLRALAPFAPLHPHAQFHGEVMKYRQRAGLPAAPRRGLHSFRHTLATRLLDGGVSLPGIAAVLGHRDVESTRAYVRISLPVLRQAAIDPDEELTHG
jgi:integrase